MVLCRQTGPAKVTLALRERVPEGRVREEPRSDACAHGNALTPTLSQGRLPLS